METTTTRPTAHTGRCPRKGCRYAQQVLVTATGSHQGRPVITRTDLDRAITGGAVAFPTCPDHGNMLRWSAVQGRYAPESKCDAQCTGAIGSECECECGGMNHGADHR